jgi:hypothetical protein
MVRICRAEFSHSLGHFETKSDAYRCASISSYPPARADVLALGNQGRRVRLVHFFNAARIIVQFGPTPWLIALIALCCDPLAIALMAAASAR